MGQLSGFADDRIWVTALLRATHGRYDAKHTELVAADHDPQERLEPDRSHVGHPIWVVLVEALSHLLPSAVAARQADGHLPLAIPPDLLEQRGHPGQLTRTGYQVHMRSSAKD